MSIPTNVESSGLSLDMLSRRVVPQDSLHLNVRISGDDAKIFEHLRNRTPNISDSLRVRDSVRTAVFLVAMRDLGRALKFENDAGEMVDVLSHLGVFYPEEPVKATRPRRQKQTSPPGAP